MLVGGCFFAVEVFAPAPTAGSVAAPAPSPAPPVADAASDATAAAPSCPICEARWVRFVRTAQAPALALFLAAAGGLWAALRHRRLCWAHNVPPSVLPAASELIDKRQELLHRIESQLPAVLQGGLEVRHLMSARLATVPPAARADSLAKIMQREHVRHLLVCQDQGKLLGIISDRDLAKRRGATAADVMTARPHTVLPVVPASRAITVMLGARISCLPVVRDERVIGILTTTDCLLGLQCLLQIFGKAGQEVPAAPALA